MAEKKDHTFSLVGSFFHNFNEDGTVSQQGFIADRPEENVYLVMTFSWMDCGEYSAHLVRVEDMLDWWFYRSAEQMREIWDRTLSKRDALNVSKRSER